MKLSSHLRNNAEAIARAWRRSLQPAGSGRAALAMSEGLEALLVAIADELDGSASFRPEAGCLLSPDLRVSAVQIASEVRTLREAVLRSWEDSAGKDGDAALADITAFNRALDEMLLAALTEHTRRLEKATSLSLAVIGHDLRNSLGAISMSATVLSCSPDLSAALARPAKGILNTVGRMKNLVSDLVDLARMRLGEPMSITRTRVDLETLCREVLQELQRVNPDFTIRFATQGDLKGDWDGPRIGQALANLVAYAVQFGSFREPILVSAQGRAEELLLSVSNRGVPTPAPLENLFDPLLQLRPPETDAGEQTSGFRLGLYIARQIALAHGGTLNVEASASDGTVFTLRLPCEAAQSG